MPSSSAMWAMASSVTWPSCSWARWTSGIRADRTRGKRAMISLAVTRLASLKRAMSLPVHVAEDGVDRRDDGNGIGHEAVVHHVGQALEVHEARPPDVAAERLGAAVRHHVAPRFAARAFDADVDLALGHLEALGEDLEVVNQRFHRFVDAAPRGRGDLLVLHSIVA